MRELTYSSIGEAFPSGSIIENAVYVQDETVQAHEFCSGHCCLLLLLAPRLRRSSILVLARVGARCKVQELVVGVAVALLPLLSTL